MIMSGQEHLLDFEYDDNALGVDQVLGQTDSEGGPHLGRGDSLHQTLSCG